MKKTNCTIRFSSFSPMLPSLIRIVAVCAGLLSVAGYSNTLNWSGAGANANWNNSANWGGATPGNGDTLIFPGGAAKLLNTNNIANLTLNQIRFAGASGGFDIRGNAFTLTNSIMATNTAGANTIENNITFTNFNVTILVSNSVSLTLAGSLGGSSTVTKNGLGTLIYFGSTANTYTNLTTVNEGELDLAKSGVQAIAPWGAGLVIGDGSGTDTVRYMGGYQIFSVVTPITITSSGVLDLNGYSDTASPFTLNGGQITTGAGVLTVSGTVKIGGNVTVSGNVALSSTLMFTNAVASTILHMNAGISGSYGITKTGVGYLFLSASNSYTGLTVVQQGWIYAQNNFALGSTNSGTVVSNGATLVLDGSIGITNESLTINGPGVGSGWGALDVETGTSTWAGPITNNANSTLDSWSPTAALHIAGPISGAGGLELFGSGSHYFEGSTANTYAGTTTVDAGTTLLLNKSNGSDGAVPQNLIINGTVRVLNVNQIANSSAVTVNSGGLLDMAAAYDGIDTLTGSGNVSLSGGDLYLGFGNGSSTFSGAISGSHDLYKEGSGAITLAGTTANTYAGTTYADSGTLVLNKSVANGAIPGNLVINGTVRLGASEQIANTGSVEINSGGTLDLNNYNETIGTYLYLYESTVTTGSGVLTLSPNCTVSVDGTTYSHISGNVNIGSGNCTMDMEGGLNISASVSGTANLIKSGPWVLALESSNSYSGLTIVAAGYLYLENSWALGSTSSGTIVSNQGSLVLNGNIGITNESLTLYGPGWGWGDLACNDATANYWVGPIALNGNCLIEAVDPSSALHLNCPISGPGGIEMFTPPQGSFPAGGQLYLEGASANTYTGTTTVDSGPLDSTTLVLNKSVSNGAIPTNLVVNGTVRLAHSQQIADTADVLVNSGGLFDLGAYDEYIDTLRGSGTVNFGSGGWIYLGLNNGSSEFDGSFTGIGYAPGFTVGKTGSGTFTMTGTNTFSAGNTAIGAGKMVINGYQPQSPVIVSSGATLGGSGTVGTIAASGNISPGTSPGILTSSNVTFTSSGNFTVELTGPNPGVGGYDQLNVTGTASLANATLNVIPAFTTPVAIGQKFIIINNDLSDAITGTFNGLAEGATITVGGYKSTISYVGGTGNDVVLTLTSIPGAVTGSTVTSGNGSHGIDPNDCNNLSLVITNTAGTPMTGINATLSTTTEGVLITQPYATYPNIPANGSGTNITPFQISTLPSFVCGNTINLQLIVNSSLGSFTMNYVLNTGESAAPTRFDNNTITNVPDIGTIESTNNVTSWSGGPITKVTVSLWLVAPIDSDLNLSLMSPDGTTVPLSTANGAGANFGSGSADASRTTFDDSAATAITAGSPPFVGTFRPQSPLSAFIGTSPNGAWRLHIQDSFGSGSPDTLRAWSLFLSGTSCNTGSGICDLCMPAITNAITLSDPVQTGRWIGNLVVASCGTPKTWPGTSAGSFHFDEYSFTNTSPADACVTVELQSPSNILATAYLNSFDPANITMNYLGDAGNSTHGGQTTFSCTVPAGATFLVVVTEVIANAGTQPYTLQLSGLPCPPPTLNIQPVATNQALLYWSTAAGGYLLESESNIVASAWATVTNEPIVGNHQYNVINSAINPTNRFYRLHKP